MLSVSAVHADDWPQWFGPRRDGVWRETGIVDAIPPSGLPVVWRSEVAGGYSGPAVADGKVVVTDFVRDSGEAVNDPNARAEVLGRERVRCYDADSGQLRWEQSYACEYKISYPAGPRAIPTIDGQYVYTLGAEGHLLCLDLDRGEIIWQLDLQQAYSIEAPMWGFTAHPLIVDDQLIGMVGGEGSTVVAWDKKTGQELWRALSAPNAGYSPPTLIEVDAQRQLVIWHPESIQGLSPTDGSLIWSIPLKPDYGMSIMAPRFASPYLFASGIGNVAALIELKKQATEAEVVWWGENDTAVYCANSTPIIDGGVIYGTGCRNGELAAVDLLTGQRLWETFAPTTGDRRASHGSAFLVREGDRYWIFSETGDLILARLSRDGYHELGRCHVIEPTAEAFGRQVAWSYPAFANRRMYVRNDRELVCVDLSASGRQAQQQEAAEE